MRQQANCVERGFTLIELLVVVSIIALLVSILLPALSRARSQAKFVMCATHQHQIVVGVMCYEGDYGKLPPSIQGLDFGDGNVQWHTDPTWLSYHSANDPADNRGLNGGSVGMQLKEYIESPDVFFCPMCGYIDNYADTTRSMEDRYKYGTGGPNGGWQWPAGALQSTYSLLWNFKGWDDPQLLANGEAFAGPGTQSSTTRYSTGLLLCDRLYWGALHGTGDNMWISSHPIKDGRQGAGSGNLSKRSWWIRLDDYGNTPDTLPPTMLYGMNAGYVDGSVRRYSSSETIRVGVIGPAFYMPEEWK